MRYMIFSADKPIPTSYRRDGFFRRYRFLAATLLRRYSISRRYWYGRQMRIITTDDDAKRFRPCAF